MVKLPDCIVILLVAVCLSGIATSDEIDGPLAGTEINFLAAAPEVTQQAVDEAYTKARDIRDFTSLLKAKVDAANVAEKASAKEADQARDKARHEKLASVQANLASRNAVQWETLADIKAIKSAKTLARASRNAAVVDAKWKAKEQESGFYLSEANRLLAKRESEASATHRAAKSANEKVGLHLDQAEKEEAQIRSLADQVKANLTEADILASAKSAGARKAAHASKHAIRHKQLQMEDLQRSKEKRMRTIQDELVNAAEGLSHSQHEVSETGRIRDEDTEEATSAEANAEAGAQKAQQQLEAAKVSMEAATTAMETSEESSEASRIAATRQRAAADDALKIDSSAKKEITKADRKAESVARLKGRAAGLEHQAEVHHELQQAESSDAEKLRAEGAGVTAAQKQADANVDAAEEEVQSANQAVASAEEAATEAHLEYETVKADGQDSIKAAKAKEVLLAADLASVKTNTVVAKAAALDALKHTSEGIDKSSKGARAKALAAEAAARKGRYGNEILKARYTHAKQAVSHAKAIVASMNAAGKSSLQDATSEASRVISIAKAKAQRVKLAAKKQGATGVKTAQSALNRARAQARLNSAAAKEAARQTKLHAAKQKQAADLQAAQWREEAKTAVAKAKAAMQAAQERKAEITDDLKAAAEEAHNAAKAATDEEGLSVAGQMEVAAADARVKIAEEQASVSHAALLQIVQRAEAAADTEESKASAMITNIAEESNAQEAVESDEVQSVVAAGENLVAEAQSSLDGASAEAPQMETAAAEQGDVIVADATDQAEQLKASASTAQAKDAAKAQDELEQETSKDQSLKAELDASDAAVAQAMAEARAANDGEAEVMEQTSQERHAAEAALEVATQAANEKVNDAGKQVAQAHAALLVASQMSDAQLKSADDAHTAQLRTVHAAKNAVKKATRDVDLAKQTRSSVGSLEHGSSAAITKLEHDAAKQEPFSTPNRSINLHSLTFLHIKY